MSEIIKGDKCTSVGENQGQTLSNIEKRRKPKSSYWIMLQH